MNNKQQCPAANNWTHNYINSTYSLMCSHCLSVRIHALASSLEPDLNCSCIRDSIEMCCFINCYQHSERCLPITNLVLSDIHRHTQAPLHYSTQLTAISRTEFSRPITSSYSLDQRSYSLDLRTYASWSSHWSFP